jgi:hypothetical protein
MSEAIERVGVEGCDPKLIEEALRRACAAPVNREVEPSVILRRIVAAARSGTRDMYGLVAASKRMAEAA